MLQLPFIQINLRLTLEFFGCQGLPLILCQHAMPQNPHRRIWVVAALPTVIPALPLFLPVVLVGRTIAAAVADDLDSDDGGQSISTACSSCSGLTMSLSRVRHRRSSGRIHGLPSDTTERFESVTPCGAVNQDSVTRRIVICEDHGCTNLRLSLSVRASRSCGLNSPFPTTRTIPLGS
jgi:hypothetical protein